MMTDKKTITHLALSLLVASTLTACTQTTPSMMNTSRIELARQTSVEQIPIDQLNDATITTLASQYQSYGSGPIDLTMMYNPVSKTFTAMTARQKLKEVQTKLRQKGVKKVTAQTLAVPDGRESLLVTFDTVTANAPVDCQIMPGLEGYETGRFLGEYKFGCGVEAMLAKQIARPSDLEGNAEMGARSARRDTNMIEGYSAGEAREPLDSPNTETVNIKSN